MNNQNNKKISDEISKFITLDETKEDNEGKYVIDFEKLKEKNSDVVAWLKVNGTNIETTVVKTTNNDYYLTHNFNKEYNSAGWIFADYKNKVDGTDKNLVIYGHNMRDNSMFGSLKWVINEDWYNNEDNMHEILTDEEQILDAIGKVRTIYPNVMQISFKNRRHMKQLESAQIKEDQISDQSPAELFEQFYKMQNHIDLDEKRLQLVLSVFEEVIR